MVDWQRYSLSKPLLTMEVNSDYLVLLITTGEKISALLDLPNHTQAVERMIKIVTAISIVVVGNEERDRLIRLEKRAERDCQTSILRRIFIKCYKIRMLQN